MTRRKKTVAETTSAFAAALPRHPLQDKLLAAAVALRTAELLDGVDGPTEGLKAEGRPTTKADAFQRAQAEFKAALQTIIYSPSEDRLYCMWADTADAAYLSLYLMEAWEREPGVYGKARPQNWIAKK